MPGTPGAAALGLCEQGVAMSAGPLWPQARPARKSWPLRWSQLNSTGKPAGKPLQLYLLLDAAQNRDLLAQVPQSGAEALFAFTREQGGQAQPLAGAPWQQCSGLENAAAEFLDAVLDVVQASPAPACWQASARCPCCWPICAWPWIQDAWRRRQLSCLLGPAVLAALLGQSDPDTQSGIDPVLRPRSAGPCWGRTHWWCWSRSGRLHEYAVADFAGPAAPCRCSSAPLRSMRW
jgi:hypothetical protein